MTQKPETRLAAIELWLEEFTRFTQAAEEWFRQATSRFAVPSDDGCRMLATYLIMLSHRDKSQETPSGQTKIVRDGKRFLRSLAAEREQIEKLVSLALQGRPARPWLLEQREILAQIDETHRHIVALLPALSPKPYPERDPIRLLAARAQEAWKETNGGRAPRSPNPDDPLCRFVVAALTAIGQQRSAAEVSEVLRGRRRKL
jgi:hypothetical protein